MGNRSSEIDLRISTALDDKIRGQSRRDAGANALHFAGELAKIRCAVREAHLANGSYCFSDSRFLGDQSTPPIDTWSETPGAGWDEVTNDPMITEYRGVLITFRAAGLRSAFERTLTGRRLGDSLLKSS